MNENHVLERISRYYHYPYIADNRIYNFALLLKYHHTLQNIIMYLEATGRGFDISAQYYPLLVAKDNEVKMILSTDYADLYRYFDSTGSQEHQLTRALTRLLERNDIPREASIPYAKKLFECFAIPKNEHLDDLKMIKRDCLEKFNHRNEV